MKGTPLLTATPLQCRPVVVELYLAKLDPIVASLVLNSSRSVAAASICGSIALVANHCLHLYPNCKEDSEDEENFVEHLSQLSGWS